MLEEDKISATLEKISADIKKIKLYIRWQKIYSLFVVLLIVVPIILGFIYLPPYVRELLDAYKSILTR
jgi:hypothetical protein